MQSISIHQEPSENNYTFFQFSDGDYLTIKIPMKLEELYRFDDGIISFSTIQGQEYDLENDYVIDALKKLCLCIDKILEGELQLHSSIAQDVGYLWNECMNEAQVLEEEEVEYGKEWVGLRYRLWGSSRNCKTDCATWLYRKGEKIFFEITPEYPWSYREPRPEENFIPYEEFRKAYKPYVLKELSPKTIQTLQTQAQEIIKMIQSKDHLYFPPGTTF